MCDCKCNCQNFKPKKESAFKKWFLSHAGYEFDKLDLSGACFSELAYKHAWDGAIDAVLEVRCFIATDDKHSLDNFMKYRNEIKRLKDK